MNLMRNPARRLGRGQPPLMRQFWLHRSLRRCQEDGEKDGVGDTETQPTESGDAVPDDQT